MYVFFVFSDVTDPTIDTESTSDDDMVVIIAVAISIALLVLLLLCTLCICACIWKYCKERNRQRCAITAKEYEKGAEETDDPLVKQHRLTVALEYHKRVAADSEEECKEREELESISEDSSTEQFAEEQPSNGHIPKND